MGINFPSSPTVGDQYPTPPVIGVPTYSWDGEKWVTAISPSSGGAPFDAMAYSGMQINGGMEVSQELGPLGAFTGLTNSTRYLVDGWFVTTGGAQVLNCSQNSAPIPAGFKSYIYIAPSTANAAPASGDYCAFTQFIEGYRLSRLGFGTAAASSISLGFWVYANRPGSYSGAISNAAADRSYAFQFTIIAATTWEYKTIAIPGDVTGTWLSDNGIGLRIIFSMMAGTSRRTAPNVWTAGFFMGATGTINGVAATSDIMLLTGVIVLPGSQAPTAAQSPLIMRPYDQELLTCKRYWQAGAWAAHGHAPATVNVGASIVYPVEMRTIPTNSANTNPGSNVGTTVVDEKTSTGLRFYAPVTVTGGYNSYLVTKLDARL